MKLAKAVSDNGKRPLNKAEQRVYNNLKQSLEEIRLYRQGKIQLHDAKEFLTTL